MNQNICNICGANYEYINGKWKCPACGAYKQEELSNEEATLLFSATQKLRVQEFEDAEELYLDIIQKYPKQHEAYWGYVCSRYGIKTEEDFDGKWIPTCCFPSIESFSDDKDFQKAVEYAPAAMKAWYKGQAEYIEKVRKEWIEKANKEEPYDIFISYKDSDIEKGIDRTRDSINALELYNHLARQGYNVFYSRESLRDKIGEKYEPYIFNALKTAKIMILYGTSVEYINSTWVKNEWHRYLKQITRGEKKENSLLVVCDGFSPNELPKVLSSKQCLDGESKTLYVDIDNYLKQLFSKEKKVEVKPKKQIKISPLHEHTYKDEIIPATCIARGYTVHKCDCGYEYKDNYTQLAEHTYELKSTKEPTCLEDGYKEYICSVCGDKKRERIPAKGHNFGKWIEKTPPTCTIVGKKIRQCSECGCVEEETLPAKGHKWSPAEQRIDKNGNKEYVSYCKLCGEEKVSKETEEERKAKETKAALSKKSLGSAIGSGITALAFFIFMIVNFTGGEKIGWGIFFLIIAVCCGGASISFTKEYVKNRPLPSEQEKARRKKILIRIVLIASAIIILVIVIVIVINLLVRSSNYNRAVSYYENKQYTQAIELFAENPHYKNSTTYIRDCSKQIILTAKKGDKVYYGFYEQDGKDNGLEPIKWTVVSEQGDELILWADYVLDIKPFDTAYSNVWADSSLNKWLNGEFKSQAFDTIEQAKFDAIYIFDNNSIETYDNSYEEIGKVTAYSKKLSQTLDVVYSEENDSIPYWTSSKSTYTYSSAGKAGYVNCTGWLWDLGTEVGDYMGVRPVIAINTSITNDTTDPLAAKFEKALSYYNSKDYPKAIEAFTEISSHSESATYIAKAKEAYYNQGIDFAKDENYSKAKDIFTYLGQYEDAPKMLQYINMLNLSSYSTITFGSYNSVPLEWSVAKKEDDRYLLVCKYVVDKKAHNIVNSTTTWEDSDIREWLNSTFYNSVFSADEKNMIVKSAISTSKPNSGGVASSYVYDKVFLLSLEEVNSLYSYSSNRIINTLPSGGQAGSKSTWWLRSQGDADTSMVVVLTTGNISNTGDYVNLYHGVRPAFYLDTASIKNQFVYLKDKATQSSKVDVSSLQNYINQGNYSTFISKTNDLVYSDLQGISFSETQKQGFYNYLLSKIEYDTYISDFCAEFAEDKKYFWLIADYKDAANIIALNSVFEQIETYNSRDNNYMALFTAKINELTPLWDTEYVRNLLTSDDYIHYYMTGYWRSPSSYYRYIRFYEKTGYSNTWMEYSNLTFSDIAYSYWDIINGEMLLFDNNDTLLDKVYKFTFISANEIQVYCYKDGSTYTLERA